MSLKITERDGYYYVYGKIEYNGRPITGTYRKSTKSTTEAGARDWVARETEYQIRQYLLGDEPSKTFSDAIMLYNASPKVAKQLIPIVEEIGDTPLRAVSGALLKGLGPNLIRKLDLQIQAATAELKDEEFLEDIRKWVRGEDGERKQITEQRAVRKWWWQHHTGAWMITLRDGAKELPLLEDKNSIEIGEIANLVDALETIRSAVVAGELDDQLAQLVKTRPKKSNGKSS